MKTPRGYLMLEAMLGSALLAIILAGSITTLADARVDVTRAQQRVVAAELAQQKLAELMAKDGADSGSDEPHGFARRWNVTALSLPGIPSSINWDVVVEVDYRATGGELVTTSHRAIRRDRSLLP